MFTTEQVYDAYLDCRRHKGGKREAIEFELDLERNIYVLCKEVNDKTYYPSTSKCFVVIHPKPREVFAANFRDRVVQHLLYNEINPCIDAKLRDNVFNCRVGKGVQKGVEVLRNEMYQATNGYTKDKYIVRLDLQNFFPSINKSILFDRLVKFLDENYRGENLDDVIWLSRIIIFHRPQDDCVMVCNTSLWRYVPKHKSLLHITGNFGLAIGNLTSQLFANFLLMGLDDYVSGFAECSGRYVDDFYMIGDRRILYMIPQIRAFLKELGITLHPNKMYVQYCKRGVKFIGHNIKFFRIHNGNRTINNAIASAKNKYPSLESLNSYLGFMRHYNMYKVQHKIITMIDNGYWETHYVNSNPLYIKEIKITNKAKLEC